MKCPICSAKISEIDAFCPNCGSAVKSETSGYMDSIDTSNLGENVGFGKRTFYQVGIYVIRFSVIFSRIMLRVSSLMVSHRTATLSRVIRLRRMAMLRHLMAVHMSLTR